MSEETARRRVPRAPSGGDAYAAYNEKSEEYDDEGKDVYAKIRASRMPVSSGRPRRHHQPPATTIVRIGRLVPVYYTP